MWTALTIAIGISLLLAGGYTLANRDAGGWSFVSLFTVLFLTTWVLALWIRPAGPLVWGVAAVPVFFGGVMVLLLLGIAAMPRREGPPRATPAPVEESEVRAGHTVFYWLFVGALLIAALAGLVSAA